MARRPVIDNDNAARPGTGSSEIAAEPVASPVVGNTSTDVTGSGPGAGPANLGDDEPTEWIQGDGPGARGANLGDDAATGQDALATDTLNPNAEGFQGMGAEQTFGLTDTINPGTLDDDSPKLSPNPHRGGRG